MRIRPLFTYSLDRYTCSRAPFTYIRILTISAENVKIIGVSMSFVHAIGRRGVQNRETTCVTGRSNASRGAETATIIGMAGTTVGTGVEL
jgi:hypothetical protein